jgi:lysophospholipase
MGGAILLAQARAGRSDFERLVLTSPMIEIHGLRFPRTIRAFIGALSMLGLGRAFAPGGGGDPYMNRGFRGNVLTSDPVRFERIAAVVAAAPELAIGDPTVGWIKAAFRLMQQFKNPEYPRRILTPTLVVAGGADALVDTPATESFAGRLKAGRFITLPGARHEILMERDPFREQFWAAFDAFVPGLGAIRDHHAADSF